MQCYLSRLKLTLVPVLDKRKSLRVKHFFSLFALLVLFTLTLSSCEIIGDIFKAGVWVGVILVLAVIAIIGWIVSKSRG